MKRYSHPIGNNQVTLYEAICDIENLKLAHRNARKGKGWYKEVKMVDANPDIHLLQLQDMLINKTYHTSEYQTFTKTDGKKERLIYKLPYYPDRICQWAIMQVIEPILMRQFVRDTYSAIPKRGIHLCLKRVRKAMEDKQGTQYCLKLDVKKYYPSIKHSILKDKYRKIFKDKNLLWLLDEIIDSTPEGEGVPIGNYLSQYSGNYFLSAFDHWIKEQMRVKYYFRYMDDIVILHGSKEYLHFLIPKIINYLRIDGLTVKDNWQIFPTYTRGLDFVGYRIFDDFILLRKTTCLKMERKMRELAKKEVLTESDSCSIASYLGWMKYCNSYRLQEKYIKPLKGVLDANIP